VKLVCVFVAKWSLCKESITHQACLEISVSFKDPPKKEKRRREKTEEKGERESEDSGWPICACFFGFKFGVGFGDHPQEGLAKFGYRSESKLIFLKDSF
jgi:hypothetical protein